MTFDERVAAALSDLRAGVPRPEIWQRHGIVATREAELRLAGEGECKPELDEAAE